MEQPTFITGTSKQEAKTLGIAWILLCVALGIHIFDEATNDFLSIYNPAANLIRQHVPLIQLPTFTYGAWLAGLIIGIIILLCLSPLVFFGNQRMFLASYLFGILMIVNAIGHVAVSFIPVNCRMNFCSFR